jgi:chromosome segregation ATPase
MLDTHIDLQILPSFRGIEKAMQRETRKLAAEIDKAISQGANDGLLQAFRNIDTGRVAKSARDTGDRWASAFEVQVQRRLKDASEGLTEIEPRANLSKFDRALVRAQQQLRTLSETNVDFGDDSSVRTLLTNLDKMSDQLGRLGTQARFVDQEMRLSRASRDVEDLADAVREAANRGKLSGGAYAREARAAIEQGMRALPEVNLKTDVSDAERGLAALRAQLEELGEKKIGVDIDRDRFQEEIEYVAAQLASLARDPKSITLKYDLEQAARQLRAFTDKVARDQVTELGDAGSEAGEQFAGAYADTVRRRLTGALSKIPSIPMTIDNTDAERALAAIRVRLDELSRRTVDVDFDAAEVHAEISVLLGRLRELDNKRVDIEVRTNAAAAAAELGLIDAGANDSTRSMTELGRETGITMSRLGYLIAIGASIGSVIAPAAATAAVAVSGLAVTAGAAVLGFGALALGLSGVGEAVKKMDAYQQDADKSARSLQQAQDRIGTAVRGVSNAERDLADARENAGRAAQDAQRRIADARRDVARAERDVAEAVKGAREAERDAVADLARVREDAREQLRRAAEAERDAERDLTRANLDQAEARRALNQALKDAVDDLRDLDTAVRRNGNEIEQANTAAMKAKEDLDKILTNPRATEIEKRMAREAYEERLIQIEELKNRGEDLREEQERLNKEGVEGTDRVKKAREDVAAADERAAEAARRLEAAQRARSREQVDAARDVADAQRRVAKAHEAVQRAQEDGAERIADAQRSLADAQRDAALSQRNSQRQIADAQQRVADSQKALARAYTDASTAGGEAFDNMRDSLNELSPAGQRFAQFLYGLKPVLQDLRREAQEGLLPGLQDGIQILLDEYLPEFQRFVGEISKSMGDMFAATAEVLTHPQWRKFFTFIDDEAVPSLEGLWAMSINVATGVANIIRTIHPLSKPMGQGLLDLSERFAEWSARLESDTGFQEFMEYAARVGPKVVNLIEQMAEFFGRLVIAAAPLGEVVVDVVTGVLEFINSWDIGTLTGVITVIAGISTVILGLTALVRTIKFVTEIWTATTALATTAQNLLAGAVTRYRTATVGAIAQTGLLNGALFRTHAAGTAGATGMRAMTAAAGPLGVALAVLGFAWLAAEEDEQNAKEATDELSVGLKELGDAYKETGAQAGRGGQQIEDSLRRIVATNEDMQRAVVLLTDMGLGVGNIAGAAAGDVEQLDKVIAKIDERMGSLAKSIEDAHNAADENGIDIEAAMNEIAVLGEMRNQFVQNAEKARLTADALGILDQKTKGATQSVTLLTPAEKALADAHEVLSDTTATAEQKVEALTRAQDAMRQSQVDAVEAEETWEAALDQLETSVTAAKDAHLKGATSLSIHSEAGRNNRDMLQNLIESANRMYDADVALNGVTETGTRRYRDNIREVKELAAKLGLSETATKRLIGVYDKIPEDKELDIYFKKGQFDKVFRELEMAAYIQKAIRDGKDIDTARHEYKTMISDRNRAGNKYWAAGGPIDGPGIVGGKTEDANLIWASRGEFMQPSHAVDFYGQGFMEAVRRHEIPKGLFDGYAAGGLVGKKEAWPFPVNLAKVWVPTIEDLQAMAFGDATGELGDIGGGRGYRWQMAVLRNVFPNLSLYSGFRPGSRTANGSLSWHARDGGRAVDVPPRMDVFNWIRAHYGAGTRELIWGGAPNANIQNGKPHRYNETLLRQHGPYKGQAGPSPHIHWAYDDGGMLPPGMSTVWNGTGKPEPVLTGTQWADIAALARGAGRAGNSYYFEFRDTTLDAGELRAIQDREAVMARDGFAR